MNSLLIEIKNKESYTANGNGNKSKGVTGSSYRNNNIELQPTDPTYATPTTEYTPAAASTVRTLQGGDGPPSYPPLPPTGQYSVLRANNDDTPPPVPAYNPNGVQEYSELRREGEKKNKQQQQQQQQQQGQGAGPLYSTLNQDDDTPPPVPPAYNPEGVQEYSVLKREGENKAQQGLSTGATGLYSTINKDTNNQVLVDESAHKPVYADLAIAAKGKRPQGAPTQEQPVVYASVNNKSVPPPIPPPAAPHKVLYADLSIAAGKRTPTYEPLTEERVVYAAVNGNRKSTTQELIMDRLGGLDIPPPIPPKPKP
uniref:Uncharacterized protein n=1 Tax=Amphimedon queenslandica TaxID=400682 RepID=A0A1X7T6Q0_AMPQE